VTLRPILSYNIDMDTPQQSPETPDQTAPVPTSNRRGWLIIVGALLVIIIAGTTVALTLSKDAGQEEPPLTSMPEVSPSPQTTPSPTSTSTPKKVTWMATDSAWIPSSTPPACPSPALTLPVNIGEVEAILYPGQERGGNYKAHGGFLMRRGSNTHTITLPIDARLTGMVRYIESGEVQYLLDFQSECGIAIRFDHLLVLTPEFQAIAETLPEPKVDDTRGMPLSTQPEFAKGTAVATEIGFKKTQNTGFDFGVYDYRQKNEASKNPAYAAEHSQFQLSTFYGVCWLDYTPTEDIAALKALPGGDQKNGKKSDYCK